MSVEDQLNAVKYLYNIHKDVLGEKDIGELLGELYKINIKHEPHNIEPVLNYGLFLYNCACELNLVNNYIVFGTLRLLSKAKILKNHIHIKQASSIKDLYHLSPFSIIDSNPRTPLNVGFADPKYYKVAVSIFNQNKKRFEYNGEPYKEMLHLMIELIDSPNLNEAKLLYWEGVNKVPITDCAIDNHYLGVIAKGRFLSHDRSETKMNVYLEEAESVFRNLNINRRTDPYSYFYLIKIYQRCLEELAAIYVIDERDPIFQRALNLFYEAIHTHGHNKILYDVIINAQSRLSIPNLDLALNIFKQGQQCLPTRGQNSFDYFSYMALFELIEKRLECGVDQRSYRDLLIQEGNAILNEVIKFLGVKNKLEAEKKLKGCTGLTYYRLNKWIKKKNYMEEHVSKRNLSTDCAQRTQACGGSVFRGANLFLPDAPENRLNVNDAVLLPSGALPNNVNPNKVSFKGSQYCFYPQKLEPIQEEDDFLADYDDLIKSTGISPKAFDQH